MSFFRKVRVLVGALVHKPFTPQVEKIDLDEEPESAKSGTIRQGRETLEAQEAGAADTERVADLIAEKQREQAD